MNAMELKAMRVRGNSVGSPVGMGASEVISAWSGKFVKNDGSGRAEIAGDGDTELMGWVELPAQTCSSTESGTKGILYNSFEDVFRIPIAYDDSTYTVNYSESLMGETCDLVVVSDVQMANLTTSAEDTIVIVGGKAATSTTVADGYVDVKLNPNKMFATGVA
jgi:hypothetical protein